MISKFLNGQWQKVIVWRIISLIVGFTITLLYLGEINSAISLTIILSVVMTCVHYVFESFWNRSIRLGVKNEK